MKQILLSFILIISFNSVINSQKLLTLEDAIALALNNNYDIQLSGNELIKAEMDNSWGTAGALPNFNLLFASNNSINEIDPMDNKQLQLFGEVNVNWTIFNGFAIRRTKRRLEELELLSKGNLTVLMENTIQSVILGYYKVLLENAKLDVIKKVVTLSSDRYDRMKIAKDLGNNSSYEVLQAKNAFLNDKASLLLQEMSAKSAKRNLLFLIGDTSKIDYSFNNNFIAKQYDYKISDLIEKMNSNNNNLKNQFINLSLLENSIALAKSHYYPKLNLSAGINYNDMRFKYDTIPDNTSNSWKYYGNLTLSYNLYNGGNRKSAVQLAKLQKESGLIQLEKIKHTLNNQLLNLYDYYQARKAILNVAEENLEAAELNMKISQEKLKSGAINSFNFRDVQIIYLNAAQQKLEAVYNLIDTQTSLLRITGGIIQDYKK